MKLPAIILTCCLLVYLLELSALPVYCAPLSKPAKHTACNKTSRPPCKNSPAQKEGNTCCITNCPLCYITTINELATPGKAHGIVKREYPGYQSNYLFIYSSTAWKPPNVC